MKTIIFIIVATAAILMALYYSGKRQAELKEQADICDQKCKAQGAMGSEFKAGGFGDGMCKCL